MIVGIVVALTFCFGFGNVSSSAAARRTDMGSAVAPAVGLSVVGLLLGSRQLATNGGPVEVLRSARRLLIFASVVTLALTITETLIAGRYGNAAIDAVGPLLLIGWAEVAPTLLGAMRATAPRQHLPATPAADGPSSVQANRCGSTSASPAEPIHEGITVEGPLSPCRRADSGQLPARAAEDVNRNGTPVWYATAGRPLFPPARPSGSMTFLPYGQDAAAG